MTDPLLSIRNLTVGFNRNDRDIRAIDDVSLDIGSGQCVGIIGESGSGKSVTALASLGLLPKQAWFRGDILFDGSSILGASESQMRSIRGRQIGFVFQDPMTTLHPLHRVGDQIAEAIRVHNRGISKAAMRERVISLLEDVAVPEPHRRIRAFPHELSGGLRQRICIAIAIANRPKLLIADEPTTALDVTVQRHLMETLEDLIGRYDMSLMLISHDIAIVHDIATDVHIFLKGNVVESGPVDRVISAPEMPYTQRLIAAVPSLDPDQKRLEGKAQSATSDTIESRAASVEPLKRRSQEGWPASAPLLSLHRVSKHYGNLPRGQEDNLDHPSFAVRDVSFDVHPGECHAIVGESGCGKSTLLKCIAGVLPVSDGAIRYKGDIVGADRRSLPPHFREQVQMVFQDPYSSLHPRMRVFDLIAEPLRNLGYGQEEINSRVLEAMNYAHVDPEARDKWPFQFSGGQRQRIGIARALVTRPEFLILDEPVSALDVSVQASILNQLNDIRRLLDLTYVFISHDLGVVNYVAERVSVMKDGRIVETGDRRDILTNPQHPFTQQLLEAAPGKSFYEHLRAGRGQGSQEQSMAD